MELHRKHHRLLLPYPRRPSLVSEAQEDHLVLNRPLPSKQVLKVVLIQEQVYVIVKDHKKHHWLHQLHHRVIREVVDHHHSHKRVSKVRIGIQKVNHQVQCLLSVKVKIRTRMNLTVSIKNITWLNEILSIALLIMTSGNAQHHLVLSATYKKLPFYQQQRKNKSLNEPFLTSSHHSPYSFPSSPSFPQRPIISIWFWTD